MPELPSCFDRADGIDGRPGTPAPEDSILNTSPLGEGVENIPIEEDPESPEIERAEQATISKNYRMSWDEALNRIVGLGRGTLLRDSSGNVTKILSCKIQRLKGQAARLIIVAEGVSFDSPPDEFQIIPVELSVNLLKHPRYISALEGNTVTENKLNQQVIRRLQDYFENPSSAMRDAITQQIWASLTFPGTIDGSGNPVSDGDTLVKDWDGEAITIETITGTQFAKAAALEIIQKYWRNEETPYIVGYQITWSSFYFRPQYLNPGGYVEDPIYDATPQLPDYFWSPDFPPSTNTIFDLLSEFNPQCFSRNGLRGGPVQISWLRKADQQDYQRTWFKIDRTWIGSPIGFWDPQFFSGDRAPLSASDYVYTSPSRNPPLDVGQDRTIIKE